MNIQKILDELDTCGNMRSLRDIDTMQRYIIYRNNQYLNLSSNDYLGLTDPLLQKSFFEKHIDGEKFLMSNPSSRLMTGNTSYYHDLEELLSEIFESEAALVLGSGYLVNNGVLPALVTPKDLIIADKLVHASIIDALKLAGCRWTRFRHNDMGHLEDIIKKEMSDIDNIYVVTESIFSMDGDTAPLKELVSLKDRYGIKLYIDEAHAFGVVGKNGLGLAEQEGIASRIDYLVATMGKAVASQGAFLICDNLTKQLLVNKMRPLIFSTALPPISLMWSRFIIEQLAEMTDRREHLNSLASDMRRLFPDTPSSSHIIPIIIGDNNKAIHLSKILLDRGYWVNAIRYPTVAKDGARLRVSLTAAHTKQEIEVFSNEVKELCDVVK